MDKRTSIIISVAISLYYIFVSGFVFKITNNNSIEKIDTPYSIAFSNIGITGIFNQDDIEVAKWIATNITGKVQTDYIGISLLIDYSEYTKGTYEKANYLFLHTWNTENNKMVYSKEEGTRYYATIPSLSSYKEIYRKGNAVAYEKILA